MTPNFKVVVAITFVLQLTIILETSMALPAICGKPLSSDKSTRLVDVAVVSAARTSRASTLSTASSLATISSPRGDETRAYTTDDQATISASTEAMAKSVRMFLLCFDKIILFYLLIIFEAHSLASVRSGGKNKTPLLRETSELRRCQTNTNLSGWSSTIHTGTENHKLIRSSAEVRNIEGGRIVEIDRTLHQPTNARDSISDQYSSCGINRGHKDAVLEQVGEQDICSSHNLNQEGCRRRRGNQECTIFQDVRLELLRSCYLINRKYDTSRACQQGFRS